MSTRITDGNSKYVFAIIRKLLFLSQLRESFNEMTVYPLSDLPCFPEMEILYVLIEYRIGTIFHKN